MFKISVQLFSWRFVLLPALFCVLLKNCCVSNQHVFIRTEKKGCVAILWQWPTLINSVHVASRKAWGQIPVCLARKTALHALDSNLIKCSSFATSPAASGSTVQTSTSCVFPVSSIGPGDYPQSSQSYTQALVGSATGLVSHQQSLQQAFITGAGFSRIPIFSSAGYKSQTQ